MGTNDEHLHEHETLNKNKKSITDTTLTCNGKISWQKERKLSSKCQPR